MMNTTETRKILKDYFCTMSYAMQYRWNDGNCRFHEDVLRLMLEFCGMSSEFETIRGAVEAASVSLGTVNDVMLMGNSADIGDDMEAAIYDIRSRIICERKISMLLPFDLGLLTADVSQDAARGVIAACKLYAYVKWLDGDGDSRQVAVEIWRNLAMNGDGFAIKALAYAQNERGEYEDSDHWYQVMDLIETADNSFSPFIIGNGTQSVQAVRRASLIQLIKRQNMARGNGECPFLDRAMLNYALYSDDDFEKKIDALTSGRDFYIEHIRENNKRCVRIGFNSSERLPHDMNIA